MKDIIDAIKKDTTFNQEVLNEKTEQALAANQKVVSLQDKFPSACATPGETGSGVFPGAYAQFEHSTAGLLLFCVTEAGAYSEREAAVIVAQTKENYETSLTRLRERLIEDAVSTELEKMRQTELETLRAAEVAAKEKIKAKLLAGLE